MKVTEENYITLIRLKDEKGLQFFMEQHGWIVKSILYQQMHSFPDGIEECLNDVFLAIWEHANQYDEEKGSFNNWVAVISKYKAIDYIEDVENNENVILFAPCEEKEEEVEAFHLLLQCLKEEDRQLFIKLYLEEKSNDEVSRETGMSKEAIYNHVSRGKRKIRRYMEERS